MPKLATNNHLHVELGMFNYAIYSEFLGFKPFEFLCEEKYSK